MSRVPCRRDVLGTSHPADGLTSCFLASLVADKVSPRAWRSISPPTGTAPHGACRNGYSAAYRRLTRLLTELSIARADGRYPKLRASLAKTHVLIIGDFGLARLTTENRRDLLENHRRPTCATLDHRHQPVPGRKVARRGRGPDLGRCDPRPTRAPCLPAQLERRIDAKTTKRVDPNRSPKLIIEPPRRFAPKRDRVDRNQ